MCYVDANRNTYILKFVSYLNRLNDWTCLGILIYILYGHIVPRPVIVVLVSTYYRRLNCDQNKIVSFKYGWIKYILIQGTNLKRETQFSLTVTPIGRYLHNIHKEYLFYKYNYIIMYIYIAYDNNSNNIIFTYERIHWNSGLCPVGHDPSLGRHKSSF